MGVSKPRLTPSRKQFLAEIIAWAFQMEAFGEGGDFERVPAEELAVILCALGAPDVASEIMDDE